MLEQLKNKVMNMIARAVVRHVDDSKKRPLMLMEILDGEDVPDCESVQQYGFGSIPHPGAEAVALSVDGERHEVFVVATDDRRYRPTGGVSGEVYMYTDEGDEIRLGRGNVVIVTSKTIKLGSDSAADPLVRQSDLTALYNFVVGHAHPGNGSPPSVPHPSAPTGSPDLLAD